MVKQILVRSLILSHRWLGVVFCLLFAMWFASGIVMHFVRFPALDESERLAALPPIDLMHITYGSTDRGEPIVGYTLDCIH
jgi:hypothetical protein